MFDALRYREYRLLWAGQAIGGLGFGMQLFASGWLVVLLTAAIEVR